MDIAETTIKTRINCKYTVTSIFRLFSNDYFEQWAWETIAWDMTLEKCPDIVERLTENDANEVVKDHARLYEKYKDIQGG